MVSSWSGDVLALDLLLVWVDLRCRLTGCCASEMEVLDDNFLVLFPELFFGVVSSSFVDSDGSWDRMDLVERERGKLVVGFVLVVVVCSLADSEIGVLVDRRVGLAMVEGEFA